MVEPDVVGLKFEAQTASPCEVVTHVLGPLYGSSMEKTVERIQQNTTGEE